MVRCERGRVPGLWLVLLVGLCLQPVAAWAQAETSRVRFVHWMYEDLGALARETVTLRTGLYAAGGMGFTLGTAWLDDDIQDQVHAVYEGTVADVLGALDYLGGPRINIPVVVVAGGSLLTGDEKFQDAAFTSLQTLVYAGLLGYGLKAVFGRSRPEWTDNPYAFFARTGMNPFSAEGNSSFPSGHAIAAFGIVTPWVVYYPSVLTYSLYVLPAGTVLNRLAHDKHWATDVVVGATIGVAMGRWLALRHQGRQRGEPRVELSVDPAGRGFLVQVRL